MGPATRNQVALTFDDGPNSTATVPILDILEARGAKGTFFVVGRAVAARPDLARAIVQRGHLVGNHSWRHDSKALARPPLPGAGPDAAGPRPPTSASAPPSTGRPTASTPRCWPGSCTATA